MNQAPIASQMYELCHECAQAVYGFHAPTTAYANRVTELLFGTAVHESAGFRHTRQIGFSLETPRGGWSFWQLEWGSIHDSLKLLDRTPALAHHAAMFLELLHPDVLRPIACAKSSVPGPSHMLHLHILNLVRTWPRLACLFARLHYMRDPEPIPASLTAQAHYWKIVYNTVAGKGTAGAYMASWGKWAIPVLDELSHLNHEGETTP